MRLPPFQLLIDDHGDVVLRYLRAAVGGQDAEDCWQDTMLSALRAYPSLRDARNLRGWLLRIAHNTAIDLHRSAGRRALPMAEPPEPVVDDSPALEPELWQAVRRLPSKQRAAVTLRFAGDLDYRAIGTMIDCSEAAARQNVRAGLAAVRREWGHARATS
jgi:RNA polymerase sigma factor (sigma-70 family)